MRKIHAELNSIEGLLDDKNTPARGVSPLFTQRRRALREQLKAILAGEEGDINDLDSTDIVDTLRPLMATPLYKVATNILLKNAPKGIAWVTRMTLMLVIIAKLVGVPLNFSGDDQSEEPEIEETDSGESSDRNDIILDALEAGLEGALTEIQKSRMADDDDGIQKEAEE